MLKERGQDILAEKCPKCGEKMWNMQTCHLFCGNCGAHLDCTDKGCSNNPESTW